MNSSKFGAFILSHGRADKVITYNNLRKYGYTGKIWIIVDNEDDTIDEYRKLYGQQVVVFDKQKIADKYDTGDNSNERNVIFFARNACFEIAKQLELDYFIQLDDDYTSFLYRYEDNGVLSSKKPNLNKVFELMIEFLENTRAKTVAMAQGGDLIGGVKSGMINKIKRKAMNSFLCKTDNPFEFVGRINEDVNTYVTEGLRGNLFFTIPNIVLTQKQTQTNSGGMTDIYLEYGTYYKSFFSCMYAPSCVRIAKMGGRGKKKNQRRIHHKVLWEHCTPMIISEKHKKG